MKNKIWITLTGLLMTLVLGGILFPTTTEAAEMPYSESIIKTYTGSVDGVEREFILAEYGNGTDKIVVWLKIGDMVSRGIDIGYLEAGPDQYGAVWILDTYDSTIYWFSHELTPISNNDNISLYTIPNLDPTDFAGFVHDVESFDFDDSGTIVIGYKTLSGEVYPLPSFEEMKEIAGIEESIPEPHYIPKGMEADTPNPSTPTPDTSASVTQVPVADTPAKTPTPKVSSKKVAIKTEKKAKVLYEGDEFIGQYTLKKGNLTWKGSKKKGKATGVKYAGFIKKSKNLVYITKQGKAYTVSFKTGKKKLIVKKKKKAKKLIYSGKFVTKIKTASGKVNVSNK